MTMTVKMAKRAINDSNASAELKAASIELIELLDCAAIHNLFPGKGFACREALMYAISNMSEKCAIKNNLVKTLTATLMARRAVINAAR